MGAARLGSEVEDDLQVPKKVAGNITRTETTVLGTSSRQYRGVDLGWFNTYVGIDVGQVRDCYKAHISDAYDTIAATGDSAVQ